MKIYYYVTLSILLMILFYIGGLQLASSSWVFERLDILNLQNFQASTFFGYLATIFAVSAGVGIIIGALTRTSPIFAIKSLYIMTPLVGLIADTVSIVIKIGSYGETWVYYIALMLLAPLIGGYAIAILEFWEGRD